MKFDKVLLKKTGKPALIILLIIYLLLVVSHTLKEGFDCSVSTIITRIFIPLVLVAAIILLYYPDKAKSIKQFIMHDAIDKIKSYASKLVSEEHSDETVGRPVDPVVLPSAPPMEDYLPREGSTSLYPRIPLYDEQSHLDVAYVTSVPVQSPVLPYHEQSDLNVPYVTGVTRQNPETSYSVQQTYNNLEDRLSSMMNSLIKSKSDIESTLILQMNILENVERKISDIASRGHIINMKKRLSSYTKFLLLYIESIQSHIMDEVSSVDNCMQNVGRADFKENMQSIVCTVYKNVLEENRVFEQFKIVLQKTIVQENSIVKLLLSQKSVKEDVMNYIDSYGAIGYELKNWAAVAKEYSDTMHYLVFQQDQIDVQIQHRDVFDRLMEQSNSMITRRESFSPEMHRMNNSSSQPSSGTHSSVEFREGISGMSPTSVQDSSVPQYKIKLSDQVLVSLYGFDARISAFQAVIQDVNEKIKYECDKLENILRTKIEACEAFKEPYSDNIRVQNFISDSISNYRSLLLYVDMSRNYISEYIEYNMNYCITGGKFEKREADFLFGRQCEKYSELFNKRYAYSCENKRLRSYIEEITRRDSKIALDSELKECCYCEDADISVSELISHFENQSDTMQKLIIEVAQKNVCSRTTISQGI